MPPNRQRTDIASEPLAQLAQSIKRLGLLQPLVVRQAPENGATTSGQTPASPSYYLVAGERRLQAVISLGWESVAVKLFESLDPVDAFEAELEENIRRVDLSMADRVRAVSQLHHLRAEQARARGTLQTFSATAAEISGKPATPTTLIEVRDSLVIAQHLTDPDIARAETTREAIKLIRKKLEVAHRAKLAEVFDAASTPHCPWKGDAYRILPTLTSGQYDCILTDPPYGIDADDFGSMAGNEHAYDDAPDLMLQFLRDFPDLAYGLLKPQGHAYIFCDLRYFERLRLTFELAGFDVWPRPLIWDKQGGMLPEPEFGPRNTYECILFANKGRRRVLSIQPDVLRVPLITTPRFGAEKPAALFAQLAARTCLPGDVLLDPFMGTGPIFPAANIARCTAHGIELAEDRYNLAITRVNEHPTEIIL